MKTKLSLLVICLLFSSPALMAQSTAFTYQGRLSAGGSPATNLYEMQFTLFDAVTNGSQVGLPVSVAPVPVTNGLFTVTLDFGAAAFMGADRWLEITLNIFGTDMVPTTLSPRQPLTPAPNALFAATAGGFTGTGDLRAPRLNIGEDNFLAGLHGTIAGGAYHDNRAVGGTISGGEDNSIDASASYSVISGGFANDISNAYSSTIGGGNANTIEYNSDHGTISGGGLNRILRDSHYATVGGGIGNSIGPEAGSAAISGGSNNVIGLGAHHATIAGGTQNSGGREYSTIGGGELNACGGFYATVGGGRLNISSGGFATIAGGYGNAATDETATVGGGFSNSAGHEASTIAGGANNTTSGDYATVGGGSGNTSSGDIATVAGGLANLASGQIATVGGGEHNTASGWWASVPGGAENVAAGRYSFSAGRAAHALQNGTFVWADASESNFVSVPFLSTRTNEFAVRATGGVRFVTAINANGSNTAGVTLAAGSGTWSSLSDRNAKENFAAADAREILDKVAALPLASWNYKAQEKSIRHLGPMAQDFHAAFGLGESDRTITTVDADGVALAAIQGLNAKLQDKEAEIQKLKSANATLEQRLSRLEQAVRSLRRD